MLGSVLLHGVVATALLISWNFTRDLKIGAVVPVTIVANAPSTDLRPAEQAPQEQTAQTEEPVPEAPPQSAPPPAPQPTPQPPAPAPKPTPPKPAPTPEPKPAPPAPTPKPAPAKAPPKKAEKELDLAALEASVKSLQPAHAKPSSAARGPARTETATQARPDLGSGLSAAAMSGLTEELQRRWHPNCEVEGGRDVQVRVSFIVGAGGQLVGDVASQIKSAQTPVSQAAADRAVRAVYAAVPFRTLPREFYGDRIAVNFNAREACSG
jgi:outer membrane biosynthesis protein TonB